MTARARTWLVAVLSLLFTYLFFIEYLPPFRRVHIPFDLAGYHYPLVDYALQALKHGSFPEWDWTIYSGQPFAGNIQAALFYPFTWLMFAGNATHEFLSYQSVQFFVFGHVWLSFFFCWLWLRNKSLTELACVLGAAAYGYSGFLSLQLQHQGLVASYAWLPAGFWSIDQAIAKNSARPLWLLTAASAMCFLAGYPPCFVVFAICMVVYGLASRPGVRPGLLILASLAASMLLVAVQLLPVLEGISLKEFEARYGDGYSSPAFYLSYVIPNFYNFGMNIPVETNVGKECLYLGAPGVLGLLALLRRNFNRDIMPILATGLVSLVFLCNPFGAVWGVIRHSRMLSQVVRDWYFLVGLAPVLAGLAAFGLDDLLRRTGRKLPTWTAGVALVLIGAWTIGEVVRWLPGGRGFAAGWASTLDVAAVTAIAAFTIYLLRAQTGRTRLVLATALVVMCGVDYKVFGTSTRLNAQPGRVAMEFRANSIPHMDAELLRQMRSQPGYRILSDYSGIAPIEMRHFYGMRSAQGFDPLFTGAYHAVLKDATFRDNWNFDLEPDKKELLRLLGVRYFITSEGAPLYAKFRADPAFRLLEPRMEFYRVFEYIDAQPTFGWEIPAAGTVQTTEWTPETRAFLVNSTTGGRFVFREQNFPGWTATIDNRPLALDSWQKVFMASAIPPGEHRVAFRYRSEGLRTGALVSGVSLLAAAVIAVWTSRKRRVIPQ